MKRGYGKIIFVAAILLLVIIVASNLEYIAYHAAVIFDNAAPEIGTEAMKVSEEKKEQFKDSFLQYTNGSNVVTMYLTVSTGNATEGTDHTWEEVNAYSAYDYEEWGVPRYKVEGLLQVGNENGVPRGSLGYGRTTPNATVQIRGQTSSRNAQKNYKIELKDNAGAWEGQKTIALNKHMTDGLRFRNKLGFDLMSGIDQLMSLSTTFVHLYVNDLTDGEDEGFVDYGLYTQVEQLNKNALKNHGLDKYGQLYKVNFFEFRRYENVIKLVSDMDYDKVEFEKYLEIKGNEDHSKLIALLEDINDESISVEELIEKHFDETNLTYWLAFNILTGNVDTQSRNCYLYSPQNVNTWYILSWDLDGVFRYQENALKGRVDYVEWERGVSNYWGNMLFRRCLKSENFRKKLDDAVMDLREKMPKEHLNEMVREYRSVVEDYLFSEPDVYYSPLTTQEYDEVAKGLPDLVDYYYEDYLESLECPLPFFIGLPVVAEEKMIYNWDASYDFQQDDLRYRFRLARDLDFKDVVADYEGELTNYTGEILEPGEYFIKVEAIDGDGHTTPAFDYYVKNHVGKVAGVVCFYLNEDGTVTRHLNEE